MHNCDISQILPRHKTRGPVTRGHSMKLEKRDCKGRTRANMLGYRIVNLWNSLPEDVVSAVSVNSFNGKFDRLSGNSRFCEDLSGVFLQQSFLSRPVYRHLCLLWTVDDDEYGVWSDVWYSYTPKKHGCIRIPHRTKHWT